MLERLEVRDLRPHVAMQADDLDALPPRIRRHISRASSIATPNLLFLRPVEMCGWLERRCRGSRGPPPSRVPRAEAIASMRSISLRFGVDAAKAELDGPRELGVRLTHSGEDDLPGVNSARSATSISPPELASAAAPRLRSSRAIPRVEFAFSA